MLSLKNILRTFALIATVVVLVGCQPRAKKKETAYIKASFSVEKALPELLSKGLNVSASPTVVIGVVAATQNTIQYQETLVNVYDRQLLDLTTNQVTLNLPVDTALRLYKKVYAGPVALQDEATNRLHSYAIGLSDVFTISSTTDAMTVKVPSKGFDSVAVSKSILAVGATQCPTGGIQVESGIDTSGNGLLDATEVKNTDYVCNGTTGKDGATGTAGANAMMAYVTEQPGINCALGGEKIQTGTDSNANGVLDTAEVLKTFYVCVASPGLNGVNSLISMVVEAAGVNCANGGNKLSAGGDLNLNGTLDTAEIQSVAYACNGAAGAQGIQGLTGAAGAQGIQGLTGAAGAQGTQGVTGAAGAQGTQGVTGAAGAQGTQGVTGATGAQGTQGVTGATGAQGIAGAAGTLVTQTAESVGTNCLDGGVRIDSGVDANLDAVLQVSEIAQTSYVCNGVGTVSSSTVTCDLSAGVLTGLTISPATLTLSQGSLLQLKVFGTLDIGCQVDLTSGAYWSSSAVSTAVIDNIISKGELTAQAQGTSNITAQFGGFSGVLPVTVGPAAYTKLAITLSESLTTAKAYAIDAVGAKLDVTAQTNWASSAPAEYDVSDLVGSKGVMTVGTGGPALISATYQNLATSAQVQTVVVDYKAVDPGVDTIWGTADDPMGFSQYNVNDPVNSRVLSYIPQDASADIYSDKIIGSGDEIMSAVAIMKYDLAGRLVSNVDTYSAGTDQVWGTADDLTYGAMIYEYNVNGFRTFAGYSASPGTDGTWGTSDDSWNGYSAWQQSANTYSGLYYNGSGVDGVWRTADDVMATYCYSRACPPTINNIYIETTATTMFEGYQSSGAGVDGIRGNKDDSFVAVHIEHYDAAGLRVFVADGSNSGADGLWDTGDDVYQVAVYYEYDVNGNLTRRQVVGGSGLDGVYGTTDDNLSSYPYLHPTYLSMRPERLGSYGLVPYSWIPMPGLGYETFTYDVNGVMTDHAIWSSVDNIPANADETLYSYLTPLYDVNGVMTGQDLYGSYGSFGTDGIPRTADDPLSKQLYFTYDLQGRLIITEYFSFSTAWYPNGADILRYGASGEVSFWAIQTPGSDATLFTTDDSVSASSSTEFEYDGFGRQVFAQYWNSYTASNRGADGVFGTDDDVRSSGPTLTQYDVDGNQTLNGTTSSPGTDGLWGTADDVFSTLQYITYDALYNQTSDQQLTGLGADGVAGTSDDVIISWTHLNEAQRLWFVAQ